MHAEQSVAFTWALDDMQDLHPDHRADLAKSGLNAETIRSLGIHSVPPGEIAEEDAQDAPWLEPGELPSGLLPVPSLAEAMIPEPFRLWLTDIAERIQCPLEFPTVGALVSLPAPRLARLDGAAVAEQHGRHKRGGQ